MPSGPGPVRDCVAYDIGISHEPEELFTASMLARLGPHNVLRRKALRPPGTRLEYSAGSTRRDQWCPVPAGARVSQAAIAQVMTASRSARLAPSRACMDRPCTRVV